MSAHQPLAASKTKCVLVRGILPALPAGFGGLVFLLTPVRARFEMHSVEPILDVDVPDLSVVPHVLTLYYHHDFHFIAHAQARGVPRNS